MPDSLPAKIVAVVDFPDAPKGTVFTLSGGRYLSDTPVWFDVSHVKHRQQDFNHFPSYAPLKFEE